MATYTSSQAGDWTNPTTWGGGGYPDTSGDIAIIGHAVRLDVAHDPAAIALGNVTINSGGSLYPHVGMNTLLSLGSSVLTVNGGGSLLWNSVPAAYTSGIYFNPSASDKGFILQANATFQFIGDPLYYGTTPYGFLSTQWAAPASGDSVIEMVGYNGDGYVAGNLVADLRAKWAVGHILALHKGTTYGTSGYTNDFCTVTITSIVKSINNGEAAVDKGGGLVGIPCTGHGCYTGDNVTIANTVNYNGTFTLHSTTSANELVITSAYAVETFGADDTATYSIRYDGTKSLIPVTIANLPGGAANFLAGGYVMHLSRNVFWGRYGADLNIGQYNTTNPIGFQTNNIAIGSGTFLVSDAAVIGVAGHATGHGATMDRCVVRNCGIALDGYNGSFTKGIIFSCNTAGQNLQKWVLDAWVAAGASSNNVFTANDCSLSGEIFGHSRAMIVGNNNQFNGGWFSNSGMQGASIVQRTQSLTMRGRIDKRLDGAAAASTYFLNTSKSASAPVPQIRMIGVTRPDPLLYASGTRNTRGVNFRITMEHDKGVKDAHRIETGFCTVEKVIASGVGGRPTQRVGGDANLYEITPQSNLDAYNPETFMFTRVKLPVGSYELRLYVQTNFADLTNGKLRFFCDYLDEVSGVHTTTDGSTESIAKRYQSINQEAAVNLGGGKVGIPVTGHAIPAGNEILIANTVNYNGTFTVHSDTTENSIVIETSFVSETFGADDVVHDLGKWDQYLSVQADLLQEQMVSLYYEVSGYDGSNRIWIDPRIQRVVL